MWDIVGSVAGVVSAVLAVLICFWSPIRGQFMYCYKYKTNFEKLEREVGKLKDVRHEVRRKVDDAKRNKEKIEPKVMRWQTEVDTIIDVADELIKKNAHNFNSNSFDIEEQAPVARNEVENAYVNPGEAEKSIGEKANGRCFKGLSPNLMKRYRHSKGASDKAERIAQLLVQRETFGDNVSYPTPQKDIRLIVTGYEDFETRRSILAEVFKALNDAKVDMVGVHGMGGVGKTTLAREVGKKAEENMLFDVVIFIEVTETPDIKKIQNEISNKLGLKLTDVPESEWRNKLYARLKKDEDKKKDGENVREKSKKNEKILIILDNIWEKLELEAIGIPSGDNLGESKLLLTARDQNALASTGCKAFQQIGILSDAEAWELFKKMAGDALENPAFNRLAEDVVKECGCLPIAIVNVANALKSKRNLPQWECALQELRNPSPTLPPGVLGTAYSSIHLSYKYLRGSELRETFLISSLMENDTSISELFKYVMSLGILEGANLTMEQARIRLENVVYELKDSWLLLDGSASECFSMHDLVRDVAIMIACTDHNVFTERNDIRNDWSDEDKLKQCTKISLAGSQIIKVHWPEGLDYPKLEFFYMNMVGSSFEIPENFFKGMKKLKVLNLFGIPKLSLPPSLDFLINLQTLCLDNGQFEDITIIGKLKNLTILSLRNSKIIHLPREIGELTQLRLLDLSNSWCLEVIAPNLISSLVELEELYMSGCSIPWEVEQENVERTNASLEELRKLSKLTALEIYIKDDKILPKGLFTRKLDRYKISIGDHSSEFGGQFIHSSIMSFPRFNPRRDVMYIQSFNFDEQRNFSTLRTLKLKLNPDFNRRELQSFKNVEFLCLDKLQGIKNVLYDLDEEGFSQLKHLRVHNNPNLLCIVDSTRCESHDVFPDLESLILFNLINLEKVSYGHPTTKFFCRLKIIEVKGCGKLKNLFSLYNARSLSQIQRISVDHCENMEEIITIEGDHNINGISEVIDNIEFFCELKIIEMGGCGKMKNLFSLYNARSLPQIQRIIVDDCENMEDIFTTEGDHNVSGTGEVIDKIEFCQLQFLWLRSLPRLTSFYSTRQLTTNLHSNDDELENGLDTLTSLFDEQVVFPSLEVLDLQGLNIERIWNIGLRIYMCSTSCQNLTRLTIKSCGKLKYVFPSCMVESFKQLKHLEISSCLVLEEIVAKEGAEANATFEFPKVTSLKLNNLPELTTFYPGRHTSEWPVLKQLTVYECSKLQIFTSDYKVDFSSLEVLSLCELDIDQEKWDNQLMSSSCQNLVDLTIRGCNKLKYLFPSSNMVDNLKHLQSLEISNCKVLEVVVAKGREETVATFKFPKVTKLILQNLPELISFYPGEHIAEWPMLKNLDVINCVKLQMFTPKYKINIPNLEELELRGKNTMLMIWQLDKILGNRFFCNQSFLLGEYIKAGMPSFPQNHQRQGVLVVCSGRAKISKAKMGSGEDEIQAGTSSFLQNLQRLEVRGSDQWINAAPPSASFQNLTVLLVNNCERMVNLISSSTAKSLMQLREMEIERCPMMIEIVEREGDAETDEIVFSNLKRLVLSNLQNLVCFCSGNCTLNFPALEQLTVEECPNMMTFSEGICSAPKFQKVMQHDEDEQLQKEEVVFSNLEVLDLKKGDINQENWDNKFMSSSCHTLKRLTIRNNEKLKYVFPFSMVKSFEQLEYLKIGDCKVLEGVVAREGGEEAVAIEGGAEAVAIEGGVEAVTKFNFPKLTSLELGYLPKLTALFPGIHTSKWPMLKELRIYRCDELQIYTSEYKVVFSNLERLVLEQPDIDQEKWDNILMFLSGQNLKRLTIWGNGKLKYVFPFSMVKSFEQLEYLKIHDCEVLEGIVAREGGEEAVAMEGGVEAVTKFIFPKLTSLELENLPKLTSLYPGTYISDWPRLKEWTISACNKLQISRIRDQHSQFEGTELSGEEHDVDDMAAG